MSLAKLGIAVTIGAALGPSVGRVFGDTTKRTARLGRAVTQTRDRLRRLATTQADVGRRIRTAGAAAADMAADYNRLGRTIDRVKGRLAGYRAELRATKRLEEARGRWQRARGLALGVGGAAYGAARVFRGALEQERAQLRLGTVTALPDLGAAVEAARDQIRGRRVLHTETQLLDAQYALKSSGLGESAARAGASVVSQVATITRGAPERVAEVMATTFNNLGSTLDGSAADRLALIGDMLTHTQLRYQIADFGQLGAGMSEAAASAKLAKLDIAQTAGAIGILNSAGYEGSRAGTALSAVLRQMTVASDDLGFAITRDAQGNLDLAATVESLGAALERYGDDVDGRQRAVQEAFGDEGKAVTALVDKMATLRGEFEAVAAAAGTAEREIKPFLDSTTGRLHLAREAMAMLGRSLSRSFSPAVDRAALGITDLAFWLEGVVEDSPAVGKAIAGLAMGMGGLVGGAVAWAGLSFVWVQTASMIGGAAGAVKTLAGATKLATLWQWAYNAAAGGMRLGRTLIGRAPGGGRAATGVPGRAGALFGRLLPLLGRVVAVVAGWPAAIAVAVLAAGIAIYKNWDRVKAATAKRFQAMIRSWLRAIANPSWANVGKAIISTLVDGVIGAAGLLYDGLKWVFDQSVGRLIPGSDAREGPLSRLTASGGAILGTMGGGVVRTGPAPLRRQLERQLAAASAGLVLAAPAAGAAEGALEVLAAGNAPALQRTAAGAASVASTERRGDTYITNHITIQQQPGEDAAALADRVLREMDRRRRRGAMDDLG